MEIDKKRIGMGIVVITACVFMLVGLIGMGICFLFIWSASIVDVIGAGTGFICGSVLMGTGLISLAILAGKSKSKRKK